ncbi:hypothetical protein B566_EDAN016392 [Ephemera danica]|nr:hypothetical protein B566_EDAN016392 [Ephemera danica]
MSKGSTAVTSLSVGSSAVTKTMSNRCVHGVSRASDLSVETIVGISGVVHGAGGAIGLQYTVVSLDYVTVAGLALALLVTGVRVSNAILEAVFGFSRQLQCTDVETYVVVSTVRIDVSSLRRHNASGNQQSGANHLSILIGLFILEHQLPLITISSVVTVDLGVAVSVAQRRGVGQWSSVSVSHGSSVGMSYRGSSVGIGSCRGSSGVAMTMGNRGGVHSVSRASDLSVETVVGISGVVHGAGGAIGLQQAVVSLDHVTVAGLALALLVAGVRVSNAVLEAVFGVGL